MDLPGLPGPALLPTRDFLNDEVMMNDAFVGVVWLVVVAWSSLVCRSIILPGWPRSRSLFFFSSGFTGSSGGSVTVIGRNICMGIP